MATTTAFLGLRKPGGGDNVDVTLDINGNMDLLDAAVAARPVKPGLDTTVLHTTYGDDFAASSLDVKWTRRNLVAGAELYQQGGGSWLYTTLTDAPGDKSYHQAAPAGDFEIVVALTDYVGATMAVRTGVYITDTAGTGVGWVQAGDGGTHLVGLVAFAHATTAVTLAGIGRRPGQKVWLSLKKVGAVFTGRLTYDGLMWSPAVNHTAAFAVNRIGFGRVSGDASPHALAIDRFNVI